MTLTAAAAQPEVVAGEGGTARGANLSMQPVAQPANGNSTSFTKVTFSDLSLSPGAHRMEVVLEPGDELPQDDRFFSVIEQADPAAC